MVTSNGLNFAINPNTGAVAAVQTNINGLGVTGVSATAYTNNFGQTTGVGNPTTQYTLDDVTDTLYIQNPPSSGTQTNPAARHRRRQPPELRRRQRLRHPGRVSRRHVELARHRVRLCRAHRRRVHPRVSNGSKSTERPRTLAPSAPGRLRWLALPWVIPQKFARLHRPQLRLRHRPRPRHRHPPLLLPQLHLR